MAIIYMGSMDDRVSLYPWSIFNPNLKSYLNSILLNTIIGHKSAINDGYILANPILRNNLFKEKSSVLRDIFSTGEIIIPGRQSSFSELIEEQLSNGVNTFLDIPKEVHKRLSVVDDELNNFGARIAGPESINVWRGFFNLMSSLKDRPFHELGISNTLVSENDFKMALGSFFSIPYDKKPPSRTEWENVLTELSSKHAGNGGFSAGKYTKSALMNLGNEAYHYNFSSKLSESTGLRIDIETAYTPAFSHLLEEEKFDIGTMVEDLPLITIPRLNNLLKRDSIEKILDNSGIGRARIEFIEALNCFEKKADDSTLSELRYKANTYNLYLNKEFGKTEHDSYLASAVNFSLSMMLLGHAEIAAFLSWGLAEIGGRVITKKFVTDRPIKVDYQKYILASTKIKGT